MFWTAFNTFRWDYAKLMALTSLTAVLNLVGPFIIRPMVDFIKTGENAWADWCPFFDTSNNTLLYWLTPEKQYGCTLALLLVGVKSTNYLLQEIVDYKQCMIGS